MEHGVKSEKREFFLYDVAGRCDGPRTTGHGHCGEQQ